MWGDNMSRITSYGKQSITDLLGKMNQAENAIDQADKTEDGKSTKKDKSKVFAGDLNLIDDPVTKKRKEAQQKALKVVKDAWDIDRSIDADIQERRDHYDKMKTLYSEAQDEVLKINDQKKALREQHMVEPDSQEQKDLELLEKRQVCMSGKFNIELTEEEWKRCEEIDKAGLTNYQEQALELNKRSIHFRKELKEAQKGMKEDVAKIKAIRLERLKSDPMVEAEKNADQIMENASKEIIGLLKQEAIDNMDEKQQEAEEKAKDTKEEKKEEEKKLEEQKLERAKQEAMMMQTKEQYQKTGGILAWHGYQSFAEGEVDASTAHEIGIKLAEELWPDFEVIVATHLNTKCFHNHFVVNSVSFLTGNKFNACKASYRKMREVSDRLCKEHQLSVITEYKGVSKHYAEWLAEHNGETTWRSIIRNDVDIAIKSSMTFQQFVRNLREKGYEVERRGTLLRLRPP